MRFVELTAVLLVVTVLALVVSTPRCFLHSSTDIRAIETLLYSIFYQVLVSTMYARYSS